jgi:hypothetical protein
MIPRHERLLKRLVEQKGIDRYGGIGWRGLMDENELYTIDQLFKPLIERGLVEDLSATELGQRGTYFVRITPLGEHCLSLGLMLLEPRSMTPREMAVIARETKSLTE